MLKKTFITFLALGAVITVGVLSSGFISAGNTAETNVEATSYAGTIVAGSVRQGDGGLLNPGTFNWSSGKLGTGRYYVDVGPSSTQAPIMIVTPIDDFGGQSSDNFITTYNHDHAQGIVYIACIDRTTGQLQDSNFSFIAHVQ